MPDLLIGCGNSRQKRIVLPGRPVEFVDLVTLDIDPACSPDFFFDLDVLSTGQPLPFPDNHFEELHGYETLEHLGRQGDWQGFFREFSEYWRVLKPGGLLCGSVPAHDSFWAWSDPGHRRILTSGTFVFLSQAEYAAQCGKTRMTDYRNVWKGDFSLVFSEVRDGGYYFALQAIKPLAPSE